MPVSTIQQLKRMLCTNEISRELCIRWVSGEYPLLYSPHGTRQKAQKCGLRGSYHQV